jgi:NAD(P)H-hydrate epimerase
MRELDRVALEETGPNLFQMMENAGRNLAELSLAVVGSDGRDAGIVVLAGAGGNGGGGICAARHLANRGCRVSLSITETQRLGEVPAFQRRVYACTSGGEAELDELDGVGVGLVIDAVIGYSLGGAPSGRALQFIQWANSSGLPILSLDVPSGVDATTGEVPGESVRADWTMTLALPKTGLRPATAGRLYLADLGIPVDAYKRLGLRYRSPFGPRSWVPITAG